MEPTSRSVVKKLATLDGRFACASLIFQRAAEAETVEGEPVVAPINTEIGGTVVAQATRSDIENRGIPSRWEELYKKTFRKGFLAMKRKLEVTRGHVGRFMRIHRTVSRK